MERIYGGCLCYGPPIENGFYYDMYVDDISVSKNEFPLIENVTKSITKEKQPFQRLEVSKEVLMEMFKVNNNMLLLWENFYLHFKFISLSHLILLVQQV